MNDKLLLQILFTTSGVLLASLAVPLILEKVKPNSLYGFRVPKTLGNPEIWYKANKYAGWRLLITAVIIVISAQLLYGLPEMGLDQYAIVCLITFMAPLVMSFVQSFIYLRKL